MKKDESQCLKNANAGVQKHGKAFVSLKKNGPFSQWNRGRIFVHVADK